MVWTHAAPGSETLALAQEAAATDAAFTEAGRGFRRRQISVRSFGFTLANTLGSGDKNTRLLSTDTEERRLV